MLFSQVPRASRSSSRSTSGGIRFRHDEAPRAFDASTDFEIVCEIGAADRIDPHPERRVPLFASDFRYSRASPRAMRRLSAATASSRSRMSASAGDDSPLQAFARCRPGRRGRNGGSWKCSIECRVLNPRDAGNLARSPLARKRSLRAIALAGFPFPPPAQGRRRPGMTRQNCVAANVSIFSRVNLCTVHSDIGSAPSRR